MKAVLKIVLASVTLSCLCSLSQADCMLQADGQTVCGAGQCRLNADGTATCADVPWGQCELGADGYWSCE